MEIHFLIKYNNELHSFPGNTNKRGFTFDEAMEFIKKKDWKPYQLISIPEEITKYKLLGDPLHEDLLTPEVYEYETWRNAYIDNNINGFSLPLTANTNNDYMNCLESALNSYCNEISKPAFVYIDNLVTDVKHICSQILKILSLLINENRKDALNELQKLIHPFMDDPFIISPLDKSYAFRGIAPFIDLRNHNCEYLYQKMSELDLTFFRARTISKDSYACISKKEDIIHLPYSAREKAAPARFSRVGVPCLYLGTTSLVCYRECEWDPCSEDMYAAMFTPNEQGKTLKILNLAISQALINGISRREENNKIRNQLQLSMIKIFPLVIATSFSITQNNREKKFEYLISQALMEVIYKMNIDGIAYLSMKGENEFQYPQGVNLALPAFDISESQPYSRFCSMFDMTNPFCFNNQSGEKKKSYINSTYQKYDSTGQESFSSKVLINNQYVFYGETPFGKFDNWLASQVLEKIDLYPQN